MKIKCFKCDEKERFIRSYDIYSDITKVTCLSCFPSKRSDEDLKKNEELIFGNDFNSLENCYWRIPKDPLSCYTIKIDSSHVID